MTTASPKVFISYSHDSEVHKDWVLSLATRLMKHGIDVVLDQWDLTLGSDLPKFMETGLSEAQRVLTVCTETYVRKSNAALGGVGYEKMILTAQLMQDIKADRIVPIIRNNNSTQLTPTFLSTRVFIDFRDDIQFETKYAELVHDLHGQQLKPRPSLGVNPFTRIPVSATPTVSFSSERYVSPSLSGLVTFDYSNNNGKYILGSGDMTFETAWSGGSNTSIHAYNDPPSISTIALVTDVKEITEITDALRYDTSSRTRSPRINEIVIWQNTAGYFLATKIVSLRSRSHGDSYDEVSFSYVIAPIKSDTFAN